MPSHGGEPVAADTQVTSTGRGRRPIPREQALEIQRARILDAMAQVVTERGYQRTSITSVVANARISRVAFYEVFDDIEGCFLALLRRIMRRSTGLITEAFEVEGSWPDRVLAGLIALLNFLDTEPLLARICLVEVHAAGPAALYQRARELSVLTPLIDAGRSRSLRDDEVPSVIAEATVAAVAGLLHNRLVTDDAPPFIPLLDQLMAVVTMPHLGTELATREMGRATRMAESIMRERLSRRSTSDTQIPTELRAPSAYRMRASFLYIAEHPGASNQGVAAGIKLRHLGQTSKILARLESLDLLTKRAGGAGRPNAWSLTRRGEHVARTLNNAW
jgi:AcrR family transcriptional regulator